MINIAESSKKDQEHILSGESPDTDFIHTNLENAFRKDRMMSQEFTNDNQKLKSDPTRNISPSSYDLRQSSGAIIKPENVYQIHQVQSPFPSLPAPVKYRIFVYYDAQDTIALNIVTELMGRLEEHFEILLVSQAASSHQGWYSDLYTAICLSHAAVLISSKDMLQSGKMQKIMSLLIARTSKHIDLFDFIFVPVLTNPMQFSNLDFTDSKHISLQFKTFSPIQDNDPTVICSQVLERLKALEPPPP